MELNKEQLNCILRCHHGQLISNAIPMYVKNGFTTIIETCADCGARVSTRITTEVIRKNLNIFLPLKK